MMFLKFIVYSFGFLFILTANIYAGSFVVSAEGGSSNPQNAIGTPDEMCAYVASEIGAQDYLYLYWAGNAVPSGSNGFRLCFYMGPEVAHFNPEVRWRVYYSDGTSYGSGPLVQTRDWQVLTTGVIPSTHEGYALDRVRVSSEYDWDSAWPLRPIHIDAVEIVGADYVGGECKIVSAAFDQEVYRSGEVATITVVTLNQSDEAKNVSISVSMEPEFGMPLDTASDGFLLEPNTYKASIIDYEIPFTPTPVEFKATFILWTLIGGVPEPLPGLEIDPAFVTAKLSPEEVEQGEYEVEQCFLDTNSKCVNSIIAIIPYIGLPSDMIGFVDNMCVGGQLHGYERDGEAWAALTAAAFDFAFTAQTLKLPYLDKFLIPTKAFLALNECLNWELFEKLYGVDNAQAFSMNVANQQGALIDSLAAWIPIGFDSTQVEYADALLIEGMCNIVIEVDSAWAWPDSTGLIAAHFANIDTVGSAAIVSKHIHAFKDSAASNPYSASIFHIDNITDPVIDIGLLHHDENDSLIFFRYPYISVTSQSILSIEVADTMDVIVVRCDYDGDGEVDYDIHPVGTTDSGDPEMPIPSGLKITNIPNPFNPSTSILYELPHSGNVRIDIYDVAGRRVKTLVDEIQEAGKREVAWNGRDANGSIVTSGVYFVKLALAGDSVTRKIVILR